MNGVRSKLGQNRSYTDNSGGGGGATKGKKRFLKAHKMQVVIVDRDYAVDGLRSALIPPFADLLQRVSSPFSSLSFHSVLEFSSNRSFSLLDPKSSRFPKENTIFIVSGRTPNFSSLNPPSSPTNFTVIDSHSALFEDRERTPIPKRFLHVVCQGKGLPDTIYACVFQRRKSASRILPRIFSTKGER